MTFNSLQYAAFFLGVWLLYWRFGHRSQNMLLLIASWVFYGLFDWRFLGLLALSTVVDYNVGRYLDRVAESRRRLLFAASVVTNLGVLGFFKYWDFFVDSARDTLSAIGLQIDPTLLRIALPVGISFYTFHGISYTCDVYRRQVAPATDAVAFACFVAYFPQLVAGPIGRAHLQLPQFEQRRQPPSNEQRRSACMLILQGLFKKVAIADVMAPIADQAFGDPASTTSVGLMLGVYAFTLQIYGDFSGYSDIARGSSRLLGIELLENFRQPYFATSVTDFWRRWHISLSSWLRDYLYVPLGGNRRGGLRTVRNLMLVMAIGGLWHGASWTFVVWGTMHGAALVVERLWRQRTSDVGRAPSRRGAVGRWFVTFNMICLAWVFFRAATLGDAGSVISGMLALRPGLGEPRWVPLVVVAAAATFLLDAVDARHRSDPGLLLVGSVRRGVVYGVMLTAIVIASGANPVSFIYFKF